MKVSYLPLFVLLAASTAFAGEREQLHVDKDRLAIKGYDPVAYFDGTATAGKPELTAEYGGAVYRFANDANRQKFVADPPHYAPAYGGWCATAMADGSKVDIDPTSFKVTDGHLYLFYKGVFGDARKKWVKDEPGNVTKADGEWKKLTAK